MNVAAQTYSHRFILLLAPRWVPHRADACLFSRGVIENHYTFLKGLNPSLRFLVRERTDPDFEPVIQAEFAKGKMEEVSVKNMSEAEVLGEPSRKRNGADKGRK